jgi:hypothetical protein
MSLTIDTIPPAVTSRLVALAYSLAAHDTRVLGERVASLRDCVDEAAEIVGLIQCAEEAAAFDFGGM